MSFNSYFYFVDNSLYNRFIIKEGVIVMKNKDKNRKKSRQFTRVISFCLTLVMCFSVVTPTQVYGAEMSNAIKMGASFGASILQEMGNLLVGSGQAKGYGDFKAAVAEAVVEELRPVQEEYKRLMADKQYLLDTAAAGAEKAARIANRTLTKAKKKVGLLLG